jgi:hypothetical protein
MIKRTPDTKNDRKSTGGLTNLSENKSLRKKKLQFPALKLEKVKKKREEHKQLLSSLFPKPVRLSRLMHDVEKSFALEFASIIGSIDFAEERLAGLIIALKELAEKIEHRGELTIEEMREHITFDQRIHQSFEDLIFESAKYSYEEVSE